jgi:hypothetical protein
VKRVLLAGEASTKNEEHAKVQSLTLYCCCLLITCSHPYIAIYSCSSAGFTEVEEDDNEGLKQAIGL